MAEEQPIQSFKPIDDKVASAIGRVSVNWSIVEYSNLLLILDITENNSALGHIMLFEASLIQRQYMIKSLLHFSRKLEWVVEWRDIEQRVTDLRGERNDIIHGYWAEHFEAGAQVSRLKARGQLQVGFTNKSSQDILNIADRMVHSSTEVEEFRKKLLANDVVNHLKRPSGPFIQGPIPSPQSLAQDQNRAQKLARRQEDRDRSAQQKAARKKDAPP